jgi:hypothetical protein
MQPGGAGLGQGLGGRYPLEGRYVCPFCGAVNETMEGPCPNCTMTNTAETRKATKSRIGPWYVLQSRNPAAPGMKYDTLLGFVRKGRVKARSIVRGPTTHQLWRFACQVKGLSREFGLCYSCGGSIEREAQLCPQCNRLQDPPADPDMFVEGQGGGAAEASPSPSPAAPSPAPVEAPVAARPTVFKEIKLPPPLDFAPTAPVAAPHPAAPAAEPPAGTTSVATNIPPVAVPPAPQNLPPAPYAPAPAIVAVPTASAPTPAPQAGPAPHPQAGEPSRKRNPADVILSARELAAAFQLDFDGKESSDDRADPPAPWGGPAPEHVLRPAPRRRRKRRTGRAVLVAVILLVAGAAAYLALAPASRQRFFDWAQAKYMALTGADLYPDLVHPRGSSASSPPAPAPRSASPAADATNTKYAIPAAATVVPDRAAAPPIPDSATRPAVRTTVRATASETQPTGANSRPATEVGNPLRRQAGPASPIARAPVTQPAVAPATRPAPPEPPRMTLEQAREKSRKLWIDALDAEDRGDYARAKALYEQTMNTLPREVWYQGLEAHLRVVKNQLGEK